MIARRAGNRARRPSALAAALLAAAGAALAADQPQWGERGTRNMVSDETGLPASVGLNTNLCWSVSLGSQSYATPVVAGGCVLIGANNDPPRDPRHAGDRGVLLCLDEKDGGLRWQLAVPKLQGDPYLDWPQTGLCSAPTVEGRRAYVMSNRGEVIALELDGMANGNDGPFRDEAALLTPPGAPREEPGPLDADVLWVTDLVKDAGIRTHDGTHASILIDGPLLYVNTCNGVDNTHRKIRCPEAPTLVAIDKETGRIVGRDAERIGPRIVHCQWSSPALGEAGGRRLIVFGGADAVVYAFQALAWPPPLGGEGEPPGGWPLRKVWSYDADPTTVKEAACEWNGRRGETNGPSTIHSMPVFVGDRVYVTGGGDLWWGKRQCWLRCLDARGTGDVTRTALVWSYPLRDHCMSTPSVHGGLVYVGDTGRTLHCVDAATGQACWTQALDGEAWGSTLVADGRVYVGTRGGTLWIFAAGREKRLLGQARLDSPISATPVAANGALYVATLRRLYAFRAP